MSICDSFQDARGLKISVSEAHISDITFLGKFTRLEYFITSQELTDEQLKWCVENKDDCNLIGCNTSLELYCIQNGLDYDWCNEK